MSRNSYTTYYPTNYNRLFNDKGFILELVTNVVARLGRHMNRTEKMYVINILQNINTDIFRGHTRDKVLDALATKISEEIVSNPCRSDSNPVNIHEMLKAQIGVTTEDNNANEATAANDFTDQIITNFSNQVEITSLLGNKTITDLQRAINPSLVRRNVYIMLDTRYRILDNDGTTYFKWNFINNEITAQGTVNAIGNIRDIISMRVFPIRIPYISSADNDYDRVTVFIQEFSAQSFIAQENRRFHYMFNPSIGDRWIDLEPDGFNDGFFRFRNPITRLDTLTISFGSPLEPIVFDTDRMLANITSYGVVTEFTTVSPHNLETGDRIYVTNFSTANINTDIVIVSAINKSSGHISTVTATNKFTIDVNSSNVRVIGAGTVSATNGSPIVTGAGTTFGIFFNAGDVIEINGVIYSILSIQSQTSLTLAVNFAGTTGAGLTYYKNNILPSLRPSIYFGSKRIFIPLEIEFYDSENRS